VIVTPESGPFSQMILNLTRSLGDFYHQRYGVTWEPEVVVHDVKQLLGSARCAVLCIASDGMWDLWRFEDAMLRLLALERTVEDARHDLVVDFFNESQRKGVKAFDESADNLTGIVVTLRR